MDIGHFYYLTDEYFVDFPDPYLMKNKERYDGKAHDRPCFLAILDTATRLYWVVPFSSETDKFHNVYRNKIEKYGKCDTIVFGDVLGHEKAFLLQNMCPVSEKYIKNKYFDPKFSIPVQVDRRLEKELCSKAKKVLLLTRKGKKLIFPDVLKIETALLAQAE